MAKKGIRANKPNDSKGTIDDDKLYKNTAYREEVERDDEEDEVQETAPQPDPVEKTATQEIGETFVDTKKDHDYKKRYDDLKSHYDKKLAEWKEEKNQLQDSWKSAESVTKDIRIPKTQEEYEELEHTNPELYSTITALSNAKADQKVKNLSEELEKYKASETQLQREKAYEELLRLQPEFDKLKSDDKFLKWLETQTKSISRCIYDNGTDAKWASRVVDLYKADTGKPKRSVSKREDAAASVKAPQVREVKSTDEKGNRIWKASEIERLKPWEFEKFESEIDKARSEGRLDLSS